MTTGVLKSEALVYGGLSFKLAQYVTACYIGYHTACGGYSSELAQYLRVSYRRAHLLILRQKLPACYRREYLHMAIYRLS